MQAYIFLYSARSQNQIKTCRISFLLPVDEEYFPYGLNPSTDLSDGGSISHRWMILLIWLSFFSPAACRWNFSFDWGKFPFEGVQTTLPGHSNLPVLKICQFTSEINNNCKVLRSFCGAHQAHNAQVCTWFVFLTWLVATLAGDMFGKRLACEPGHAGKKRAKPWPQNVSKVCLKICLECYKYLLNYRS